jgi:hypothetical protein
MLGLEDLAAPAADRVYFFDFSALAADFLVMGSGLTITLTTLDVDMLGLEALADPGADRIYFFDNSGSTAGFLTAGDGLTITLTDLDVDMLGLEDLAAPGADRIYFFDQSSGFAAFLTVGSGLDLTGTTLTATAGAVEVFGGHVPSNGIGETLPSGWSAVRNSAGSYTVTHSLGLANAVDLAVSVTQVDQLDFGHFIWITQAVNSFSVFFRDVDNTAEDEAFNFVAVDFTSIQ